MEAFITDRELYEAILEQIPDFNFWAIFPLDNEDNIIDRVYHYLLYDPYRVHDEKWYNLMIKIIQRLSSMTREQIDELIEEEKQFWLMIDREIPLIKAEHANESTLLPPNAVKIDDLMAVLRYKAIKPTTNTGLNTLFDLAVEHGLINSVDRYLYQYMMSFVEPDSARCSCCRRIVTTDQFPKQLIFRPHKDNDGYHLIKACKQCEAIVTNIYHCRAKLSDEEYLVLPPQLTIFYDHLMYIRYNSIGFIRH